MSKYVVTQYDQGDTVVEADGFGVIDTVLYLTNAQGKTVAAFNSWLKVAKQSSVTS